MLASVAGRPPPVAHGRAPAHRVGTEEQRSYHRPIARMVGTLLDERGSEPGTGQRTLIPFIRRRRLLADFGTSPEMTAG